MSRYKFARCAAFICAFEVCFSALCLSVGRASEFDVRINEVHYHPFGGSAASGLEFVELYNAGATDVDMSGWKFAEGIEFTFPAGTVLPANGYLIASANPGRASQHYDLPIVYGPYDGKLANGGENIALYNSDNVLINRVHFEDRRPWAQLPDGLGPSLEYAGGSLGNDYHGWWCASVFLGGTPAAPNSRQVTPPPPLPAGEALLAMESNWRIWPGSAPPSNGLEWTSRSFDDASWSVEPGGFGYGRGHGFSFSTRVDMRGEFTTLFVRGRFALTADELAEFAAGTRTLRLSVSYDDAFVAFLNGVEIGRHNVGAPGDPIAFDGTADSSDFGTEQFVVAAGVLEAGDNVLAVVGLNSDLISRDFFLGPELVSEQTPLPAEDDQADTFLGGILNEVMAPADGGAVGFVEVFNPHGVPLDLSRCVLFTSTGRSYEFPADTVVAAGEFLVIDDLVLGFLVPEGPVMFGLLGPDQSTLLDVFDVDVVETGLSFGRYPDGADEGAAMTQPSPAATNRVAITTDVVVNEIYFHPPYVEPTVDPVDPARDCPADCSDRLQWIELVNRSDTAVDLTGWRLTRAVTFDFPEGTTLEPGAFLVVAASEATFRDAYPGVDAVIGDWSGRLRHNSDEIRLRNAIGNVVDSVRYGDGRPRNDREPNDGIDDQTFRSWWPGGADGEGASLELLHPELENAWGYAWRASDVSGGTPGAVNSAAEPDPPPIVGGVKHAPPAPTSAQPVRVSCYLSSVAELTRAEVQWTVDGGGSSGVATLRDDGLSGDGTPGDGVYGAEIPAQSDGAIVSFQIVLGTAGSGDVAYPLAPAVAPYGGFAGPYFLYEVDDSAPPANGNPSYRIVMTAADENELGDRDLFSDVLLPATFIAGDEVHYLAGVRYRGENSRREDNRSYRVEFPPERDFDGTDRLNLNANNGSSSAREILSADLFRRAGQPYPIVFPITLHFPGEVSRNFDSRYIRKENFDTVFLNRFFGDASDEGNFYRARNPEGPGAPSGDLLYLGEDKEPYREIYDKKSNQEEDDYSDIIELCRAFDRLETPDEVFADTVDALVDSRQWAQFFAVMGLLGNTDGGIWNNNGEDYFLYHVPADSPRPDAGKFLLLPWDLEETYRSSGERLFRPTVPAIERFLSEPRFAQHYYAALDEARHGIFARVETKTRYGFVSSMFAAENVFEVVDGIDSFIARRHGYLDTVLSAAPRIFTSAEINLDEIVSEGATWKFFRGVDNPEGGPGDWTGRAYDDESWEEGPAGIGYGDGDDATVLEDMFENYTTVFVRRRFDLEGFDPENQRFTELLLQVNYDDAFVAYINGVEVARSPNAPGNAGDPVSFDTVVTAGNHEAGDPERFPIATDGLGLQATGNVLALVGINGGTGSSDFSLHPSLFVETAADGLATAGGCGDVIYADGERIVLRGVTQPIGVRSVTVDGELAASAPITTGGGPFGVAWTAEVTLSPGENNFSVRTHASSGGTGPALELTTLTVYRFNGSFQGVSGELSGTTTWTPGGGPYLLTGRVLVPSGSELQIAAGTVILGLEDAGLEVEGLLRVEGDPQNPVEFLSNSCVGLAGGIVIRNTGADADSPEHLIQSASFRFMAPQDGSPGLISVDNARVRIEGCEFSSIFDNVVEALGARVEIHDSWFVEVFEAVHCTNSFAVVADGLFQGILGDSDAIDFDGTAGGRSVIRDCRFEDGTDDGIDLGQASVDIINNVMTRISDKAISIEESGGAGEPVITGNLVFECGTALALKDGVSVSEMHHNTFAHCDVGFDLFAKDAGPEGGHAVAHSSIFWGNVVDVRLDDRSILALTYSDVGYGEVAGQPQEGVWPGAENISEDPLFVASLMGDFALRAESPCIGTGLGASDMGAVPSGDRPPVEFTRGDSNRSGDINIADPINALNYLFAGTVFPTCLDPFDGNDDGGVNIADPIYVLSYLFGGGPPPPAPFPLPGTDPSADSLACDS